MTDHSQAIRAAWIRARDSKDDWIEATLDLAAELDAAKRDYPATQDFGQWCDKELFYISHQDRAGLLRMAGVARDKAWDIVTENVSHSWRALGDLFPTRVTGAGNSDLASPSPPETDEKPAEPVENRKPARTGKRRRGHVPKLAKKFGAPGEAVHLRLYDYQKARGWTGGLRLSTLIAETVRRPQTIRKLADYLAQPDIPKPSIGSGQLHAMAFWPEIPAALAIRIHGHRVGEEALVLFLDKWEDEIAPHYRAWCEAGKPRDVEGWFKRRDTPRAALALVPPPSPVPAPLALPPRENYHAGFQPDGEGPIKACGVDLWPAPPFAKWTFREAFYAYHLWQTVDRTIARTEFRPAERARMLMNPFTPILKNLSLGAGEAFEVIIRAQMAGPLGVETESFAPSKKLVLQ